MSGTLWGGVALEDHVLEGRLVIAAAGALADGPLDNLAGDARLAGLFDSREKAGVGGRIAAAELGGHGDFFHQFADGLTLLEINDCAFRVQPLTTHRARAW
jgi:hypothetical protein